MWLNIKYYDGMGLILGIEWDWQDKCFHLVQLCEKGKMAITICY